MRVVCAGCGICFQEKRLHIPVPCQALRGHRADVSKDALQAQVLLLERLVPVRAAASFARSRQLRLQAARARRMQFACGSIVRKKGTLYVRFFL